MVNVVICEHSAEKQAIMKKKNLLVPTANLLKKKKVLCVVARTGQDIKLLTLIPYFMLLESVSHLGHHSKITWRIAANAVVTDQLIKLFGNLDPYRNKMNREPPKNVYSNNRLKKIEPVAWPIYNKRQSSHQYTSAATSIGMAVNFVVATLQETSLFFKLCDRNYSLKQLGNQ